MIIQHYTDTATNTRMQWVSGMSSLNAVGSFACHIQQAQPQFAQQLGETWGLVFKLWCDVLTDVKAGDTITMTAGSHPGTYNVRNVQKFNFGEADDHLELVLIKDVS